MVARRSAFQCYVIHRLPVLLNKKETLRVIYMKHLLAFSADEVICVTEMCGQRLGQSDSITK